MSERSRPKLTAAQRAAIQTVDENLLVSAAAGSGKTTVLAERCAYLLCDAEPPCSVDQLLVVTFTEAAAAQMKGRIEGAIANRLAANPGNERLRRQAAQIDRAQVSTLHAFCNNLLRMHFHLLGMEPSFSILDQEEAALLRRETVQELFARAYEEDAGGDFQRFVDWYGDGNDAELQKQVLKCHEMLCSLVEPEEWLATAEGQLAEAAEKPLGDSALGKQLVGMIEDRLDWLLERCESSAAMLSGMKGLEAIAGYVRLHGEEVAGWKRALSTGGLDQLAMAVSTFSAPKKPPVSKTHPQKAIADSMVEAIRDEMGCEGSLGTMVRFSAVQWQEGLRSMVPSARVFLGLVKSFGERYAEGKARVKGVDFADLERLTLRLLREKDAGGKWIPSAVARQCHARFAHVLVDEYQDINALQDEILRLVSRECLPTGKEVRPNLFAVGDVKQSIYRFRLADPQRFLARDARYRKKMGGQVIDLQQNFRSRAPLLAAINSVFVKLMTRQAAMIEYDQSQQLHAGATFPECDREAFAGSPIELHVVHSQDAEFDGDEGAMDRTEWEATLVARRIKEMVASGVCVAEGAAMRPMQYRDVVVLLRSAIHKADQMAEILGRHGIPVHSDTRDGFFAATEIRDVLAVLELMDNSQQDIPLAAYLRGPLAGLGDVEDGLARVRLAYASGEKETPAEPGANGKREDGDGVTDAVPFHVGVFRYAEENTDELAVRLRKALAQIARWRRAANRKPLADVIWTIFEETDFLAFCGTLERGRQRVANLLALHERAREFGSFASQGLYRFLRYLRGVEEETDEGQASMLGEGENAVRIMTVHQSKGLEFPVVFLPDLGKGFNLADMNGRILLDRGGILGMPAVNVRKQVRYPSMGTVLARQQMRQQIVAEELRVLYVAMTRAREHLVLVGSCREGEFEKWTATVGENAGALSAETVIEAKSPLQWLVQTYCLLEREGVTSLKVERHTGEEMSGWVVGKEAEVGFTEWQRDRAALKPLEAGVEKSAVAEEIIGRLTHVFDDRKFVEKRAAVSVTEWGKGSLAGGVDLGGSRMRKRGVESDLKLGGALREHPPLPSPDSTSSRQAGVPVEREEGKVAAAEKLGVPRSLAGKVELLATEKGTATHLVLQHLVMSGGLSIGEQVAGLVARCLMREEQAACVDFDSIQWFLGSELGRTIAGTPEADLMREVPFALALGDAKTQAIGLDRTMLRGRIDLMVRSGEGWIVVDYKTDAVRGKEVKIVAEGYRRQVELYREALERLGGVKLVGVYLVFLSARVVWEIEPRRDADECG